MTGKASLLNRSQTAARALWSPGTLVALLLSGVLLASSVEADEHHYVLRDGTKVPIVYSETEIGVILSRNADSKSVKARLKTTCDGDLVSILMAPESRIKLLRVTKATQKRRDLARQDPSVHNVGKVFRFRGSPGPVITFGKVAVKLRTGMSDEERGALWTDYGLTNIVQFHGLHDVYTGEVKAEVDEMLRAERLADDPRTLWAHPDTYQVYRPLQVTPSDPFFGEQWHLNNTGLLFDGVEDADIDALEAWAIAEGDGVLFGMFDHGCDVDHEDLVDRYIGIGQDVTFSVGTEGADNPRARLEVGDRSFLLPGDQDDVQVSFEFHGTNVMGLAVASGNSLGVRGVSFRSRFTASRGLELVTTTEIARAYPFAIEQGVDVHINSWGPIFASPVAPIVEDAIDTAFQEGRDLDGPGGNDPLGMLIFFAAGNGSPFTGLGEEIAPGFGPSTLPSVIAVGASNVRDQLAPFSNFGRHLNFIAPGEAFIATTDNEDKPNLSAGLNRAGVFSDPDFGFSFTDVFGVPILDLDPAGKYTGFFNGTSAACPIAAGVAGLVLSTNAELTATDVRIIMEHTCDRVDVARAVYNGITSRSFKYGYGRVNANQAVLAAQTSLANGGLVWPDIPSDVRVIGSTLSWIASDHTSDFLVVSARSDFEFDPEDDVCYDASQLGCGAETIAALPDDPTVVSLLFAGCNEGTDCTAGTQQSVAFDPPEFGRLFFAIYARNAIGQYSFGIPIDSTAGTSGGETGGDPIRPPAVSISATPLQGVSPLTVTFNGNAVGDLEIDGNRTEWNFDVVENDVTLVDATTPATTHPYTLLAGETSRKFTARLKMFDVEGREGSASVQIRVTAPAQGSANDESAAVGVSIATDPPGSLDPRGLIDARCETSVCGTSPFLILFHVDTSKSDVTLSVQSVVWDLGDGNTESSLSVWHTYANESDVPFVVPVSATITFIAANGLAVPKSLTKLITVLPGAAATGPLPPLPGTGASGDGGIATPCGLLSIMPLMGCLGGLFLLRRRGA